MRTVNQTLLEAIANQQGDKIFRVLTWNDIADYNANPNTPDHTWTCIKYNIENTSASATIITENDYTLSDFTVFIIERGANISGVEYTVKSGLMFLKTYIENYGKINITGSSYPNIKISIAGHQTYEQVIDAFCTAIGKTGRFKDETATWLDYKFLPADKIVSLNKAEAFESMLRQKYTILVYEESPKSLVFYTQDDYIDNQWQSVAWAPEIPIFAAVAISGTGTRVMTSPDGINWSRQTSPEDNFWRSICWSPELGIFCAVAQTGTNQVMTSPNGKDWTLHSAAEASGWLCITWSPELGIFCAVANSGAGNRVMTSPDGINWTGHAAAGAYAWIGICWSPELNLFCAVANAGVGDRVMTSPDGINWTLRTPSTMDGWCSVAWSPELNLFCAVAQLSANVMTSPDGITWTDRTPASSALWRYICWSPELSLFCAVSTSENTTAVMTSPDGITWTSRTTPLNYWNCVIWVKELGFFIAVAQTGKGDRVMTSPDGITWTNQSAAADYDFTYLDGPKSYIDRSQHEVYYFWVDEAETEHTEGTVTNPQWHLGYLESTDDPPTTKQDPYYKIYLQKAPVRLDITDGDKINFLPYWSIDPSKSRDAMMQITEVFDIGSDPTWYQEIRSIELFDKVEGGALPSTIERVANYTPLNTTYFDTILSSRDNNVQAAFNTLDDHNHTTAWTLLASTVLPTDEANIDFQSIPATYKNLLVIAYARTNQAGASDNVVVRFNNDSGNNYYALRTNIAHSASMTTVEQLATGAAGLFSCAGDNAPANFFAPAYMVIPAYTNTSNHKTTRAFGFTHGATTTGNQTQRDASGVWKDTSAINRITFLPALGTNFKAGTRIYLYGA